MSKLEKPCQTWNPQSWTTSSHVSPKPLSWCFYVPTSSSLTLKLFCQCVGHFKRAGKSTVMNVFSSKNLLDLLELRCFGVPSSGVVDTVCSLQWGSPLRRLSQEVFLYWSGRQRERERESERRHKVGKSRHWSRSFPML